MTLCKNCEHLHSDSGKNLKYWMCTKFPRVDRSNNLDPEQRIEAPYMYCIGINGGKCPLYKEREGAQVKLDLGDKE